ncbi:MAG: hypothetical protein KKD64_01755 [Alphaproteobacteria bacterium]|nr:hypothetical protein [Alphaproteobacteria bacterium]MBU0794329.1 hypothetical protein [Alphaproteobacteria bacterium]MBU0876365.1 hypothetical protein [Alphaproteobacteria bacterium]MBU1768365.1 hypothetical protein [Alphaproteobacteria bacterium]
MVVSQTRLMTSMLSGRFRSALGPLMRELKLYGEIVKNRGAKPRVMILPSHDRQVGSSLLRAYNIADHLAANGWATIICHKSLSRQARQRIAAAFRPDIILIQKSRHPANLPKHYGDTPIVFDIDDADFLDPAQEQRILECMKGSRRVIAGSKYTADWCRQHHSSVDIVWTGTPVRAAPVRPQSGRAHIVAWASSGPHRYPKEASFVLDVMRLVALRRADVEFRIYGDMADTGFCELVEQFKAKGVNIAPKPYMAYDLFLKSLEEISVGLNPVISVDGFGAGKSFGKVLAYLDAKVPTISTPNVDHPLFFKDDHNGYLIDASTGSPEFAIRWAEQISTLIDDEMRRERVAEAAREDLIAELSLDAAGRKVDATLRQALREATPVQGQ